MVEIVRHVELRTLMLRIQHANLNHSHRPHSPSTIRFPDEEPAFSLLKPVQMMIVADGGRFLRGPAFGLSLLLVGRYRTGFIFSRHSADNAPPCFRLHPSMSQAGSMCVLVGTRGVGAAYD